MPHIKRAPRCHGPEIRQTLNSPKSRRIGPREPIARQQRASLGQMVPEPTNPMGRRPISSRLSANPISKPAPPRQIPLYIGHADIHHQAHIFPHFQIHPIFNQKWHSSNENRSDNIFEVVE